ncbi:MAG: ComF family protein [Dehalococcoidales bacterium]|nr:ComF family protein [Dehalococcoidales bacterium]
MADLGRVALDLLFPQWCLGCGREGSLICEACRRALPFISSPVCGRCGRPLGGGDCSACQDMPGEIDGIRAPFVFDGIVRRAVHELKYRNLRALAPVLAGFLADCLCRYTLGGDVIVPMPLHPRRLRERGYNQAELLAGELGRLAGLPVDRKALRRIRHAPTQVNSAGLRERLENVRGAFSCWHGGLAGKRVILVDDVVTSGATMNAAAGALKEAGAVAVWGLAVALEL